MTDYIATHSKKQTFNVGSDGLFKRHDYDTEVVAGGPAAHYPSEYREFGGIMVPIRGVVATRDHLMCGDKKFSRR